VIDIYTTPYPELIETRPHFTELEREEKKFLETLQKGEREFEKMLPNLLKTQKNRAR